MLVDVAWVMLSWIITEVLESGLIMKGKITLGFVIEQPDTVIRRHTGWRIGHNLTKSSIFVLWSENAHFGSICFRLLVAVPNVDFVMKTPTQLYRVSAERFSIECRIFLQTLYPTESKYSLRYSHFRARRRAERLNFMVMVSKWSKSIVEKVATFFEIFCSSGQPIR